MPKVRATTQEHIDIEEIVDNLILLKDGTTCMVVQTNAINFGLLSEEEQDATIYAYAALLNSLTFTIQILIRSESKDISGYVKLLREQKTKQQDSLKRSQISSYTQFISSLVTERNVLEKKFYLIIPFTPLELGVTKSFTSSFSTKKSLPFDKTYILEKATQTLEPRRDHLFRQLGRLGLAARQLTTQELIRLLYSMYNPSSTQGPKISNTKDYTVPLVQPAYINPKEANMSDTPTTPSPATPTGGTPEPATPTTPSPAAPAGGTPSPTTPAGGTPSPATPTGGTPEPATPTTPSPAAPTTPSVGVDTPPPPTGSTTPSGDPQQAINSAANDITGSTTTPDNPAA